MRLETLVGLIFCLQVLHDGNVQHIAILAAVLCIDLAKRLLVVKGKCKNSFRSEKTMHQAMDKIAKCEIKQELE